MKKSNSMFTPIAEKLLELKKTSMIPYVSINLKDLKKDKDFKNVESEIITMAVSNEVSYEDFQKILMNNSKFISEEFVKNQVKSLRTEFETYASGKLSMNTLSWGPTLYGLTKKIGVPLNYYCQDLHMKLDDLVKNFEEKGFIYEYIWHKINGKISKFDKWKSLLAEVGVNLVKNDVPMIVVDKKGESYVDICLYIDFPMSNHFLYQRLSNGKRAIDVIKEISEAGNMN